MIRSPLELSAPANALSDDARLINQSVPINSESQIECFVSNGVACEAPGLGTGGRTGESEPFADVIAENVRIPGYQRRVLTGVIALIEQSRGGNPPRLSTRFTKQVEYCLPIPYRSRCWYFRRSLHVGSPGNSSFDPIFPRLTMKNDICPEREVLQQLIRGNFPEQDLQRWEEHLLHCSSCAKAAETLRERDELTAALKPTPPDDATPGRVVDLSSKLSSQRNTGEPADTIDSAQQYIDTTGNGHKSESSVRQLPEESAHILADPGQPGQIGQLGGYRILEVLGIGGMGIVYRAEDPKLKRPIALKVMKASIAASRTAKERFVREAQAAAGIDHDNIITIYQVGEENGVPFIAMRYLQGESLESRLRREKRWNRAKWLVLAARLQVVFRLRTGKA